MISLAVHGSAAWLQAVELRRRVLRRPLGLDFTRDELAAEAPHQHLVLSADGSVRATLMLVAQPPAVKLRQMAVDPGQQGRGLGRQLVEHALALARDQSWAAIHLHARTTALGFYERLGFEATGAVFTELGIPHVAMHRDLRLQDPAASSGHGPQTTTPPVANHRGRLRQ